MFIYIALAAIIELIRRMLKMKRMMYYFAKMLGKISLIIYLKLT